jgi:hypothetical protein
MLLDKIHFSSYKKANVKVFMPDQTRHDAELQLIKNQAATLIISGHRTEECTTIPILQLSSSENSSHYTLFECISYGDIVYPELIIKSKSHNGKFRKIALVMDEFTRWYAEYPATELPRQFSETNCHTGPFKKFSAALRKILRLVSKSYHSDISEVEVKPNNSSCNLRASISHPELGDITISTETWLEHMQTGMTDSRTTLITPIIIESKRDLSTKELIRATSDVQILLSILIGHKIPIDYCYDLSNQDPSSIYFYENFNIACTQIKADQYLIQARQITSQDMWKTIFSNALCKKIKKSQIDEFKDVFRKLPHLPSASNFWELEFLATAALVDAYSKKYSDLGKEKLTSDQLQNLKDALNLTINEFDFMNNPDKKTEGVVSTIKGAINRIENTNMIFSKRFEFTTQNRLKDIYEEIPITETDFKHIKNLRDAFAHGNPFRTEIKGENTAEKNLQKKLTTYLYAWALSDLGFSNEACLKTLKRSRNPYIHRISTRASQAKPQPA